MFLWCLINRFITVENARVVSFFIIAGVMFYCPFKFDDDDAGDGLGAWGLFGVH